MAYTLGGATPISPIGQSVSGSVVSGTLDAIESQPPTPQENQSANTFAAPGPAVDYSNTKALLTASYMGAKGGVLDSLA